MAQTRREDKWRLHQGGFRTDAVAFTTAGDGRRFLLLRPVAGEAPPPLTVVVNWPSLLPSRR